MHLVPVIILLVIAISVFGRYAGRARGVSGTRPARPGRGAGSPRGRTGVLRLPSAVRRPGRPARAAGTGFLGHRRAMAAEKLRHRHAVIRDDLKHRRALVSQWAAHTIRMRERQAAWDREDAVKTVPPPAAPQAAAPQAGAGDSDPGTSRPAAAPPPATVPGSVVPDAGSPAPPPPRQPAPQPEGNPVSTPGAVEPIVDGLHAVHARAAAGNIHAKHWAIKVCAELCTRLSALLLMTSRTLAERGYGPEISEPLARAGTMTQAASMACGESDTAITALKNMTVGDLADSPRQAPERGELSETGAY